MKNQLHYILFRLFWDDKPVGFEYWAPETNYSYTHGNPETKDGYKQWGWSATKIPHNSKEILEIKYIDEAYLKEKEERKMLGESMVRFMEIGRILAGKF
jgi:hypothetical protein